MKINLFCIAKLQAEDAVILHYQKQCKQFGTELKICNIFNTDILHAQKRSQKEAQNSYTRAFLPYLKRGVNFSLHPDSKMVDSFAFSKMLNEPVVNFFIGGAYGFENDFLVKTQAFSLSLLTLSHKVAKIVLCEQIYRGLSILNHHPYHK